MTPLRLSRPVDFDEFWQRTLVALDGVRPALNREVVGAEEGVQLESLSFASLGDARVHAYRLAGSPHLRRPLVVHAHGYGGASEPRWELARAGWTWWAWTCAASAAPPRRSRLLLGGDGF